jgi:ABC-type polysaccharide/polyol phosphate export systems, permease component
VFYSIESIPERFRFYMMANPLTLVIEQSRQVLIYGLQPDFHALLILSLVSIFTCCTGLWFFNKTRKGFSDVL